MEIHPGYETPKKVVAQYPAQGWQYEIRETANALRIIVGGTAKDRLLVLE